MIKAMCYTDDDAIVIGQFDATPWFQEASVKSIRDLRADDYGPGLTADDVAMTCADSDRRLAIMFEYIDLMHRYHMSLPDFDESKVIGFTCTVDRDDAEAWIAAHRPRLKE